MVVAPTPETEGHTRDAQAPKRYMTSDEAAALFGVSSASIRRYAREGVIPSYRLGGRVLFKLAEIEEAIRK